MILLFTILNCFGIGRIAKLQTVLTATKLVVLTGFVILGFTVGAGDWSHFSTPAVRTSTPVPNARTGADSPVRDVRAGRDARERPSCRVPPRACEWRGQEGPSTCGR